MQKGQGGGGSDNEEYTHSLDKLHIHQDHLNTLETQNINNILENVEKPKVKRKYKHK